MILGPWMHVLHAITCMRPAAFLYTLGSWSHTSSHTSRRTREHFGNSSGMLSDEAKRSFYAIESVRFTRGSFIQVGKENKLQGTVHRFLGMTMALPGTPPFLAIRCREKKWRPRL
ncbi:hypothetical protein BJX66DRAFT_155234 [Aspergillus keveii]|uniref:Secreted protein n=1 Tax=Aspergillus keveii TaxID=714993 RepID=A0ABR4FII7_9EURO